MFDLICLGLYYLRYFVIANMAESSFAFLGNSAGKSEVGKTFLSYSLFLSVK